MEKVSLMQKGILKKSALLERIEQLSGEKGFILSHQSILGAHCFNHSWEGHDSAFGNSIVG